MRAQPNAKLSPLESAQCSGIHQKSDRKTVTTAYTSLHRSQPATAAQLSRAEGTPQTPRISTTAASVASAVVEHASLQASDLLASFESRERADSQPVHGPEASVDASPPLSVAPTGPDSLRSRGKKADRIKTLKPRPKSARRDASKPARFLTSLHPPALSATPTSEAALAPPETQQASAQTAEQPDSETATPLQPVPVDSLPAQIDRYTTRASWI